MISVISPVYNESENIIELCERMGKVLDAVGEEAEFILIENGSDDDSLELIKSLRAKDPRVKLVSLSRNFGHQGGLLAGLAYAKGDAVISIDGDLQHPPELIPKMIESWKNGFDIVYTTKKAKSSKLGWPFIPTKIFYGLISKISDINLDFGQSDYRLLDRKVVNVINNIPEKNKFLRGLVEWVGFKQQSIEYEVEARRRGRSKFSLKNYFNFALDGIFSFSIMPLRIFLWLGLSVASLCVLYAIFFSIIGMLNLFSPERYMLPPGWTTIAVSVLFTGGVQLIGIGFLGEYIGRVYTQAKGRPDFIVKEKQLD